MKEEEKPEAARLNKILERIEHPFAEVRSVSPEQTPGRGWYFIKDIVEEHHERENASDYTNQKYVIRKRVQLLFGKLRDDVLEEALRELEIRADQKWRIDSLAEELKASNNECVTLKERLENERNQRHCDEKKHAGSITRCDRMEADMAKIRDAIGKTAFNNIVSPEK